jgi:hypothetical protein
MTHTEEVSWREFYKLWPFDDLHRFHRPAAMVASSLGGGDVQSRLNWLAPEPEITVPGYSAADMATFKAFGAKPPQRN